MSTINTIKRYIVRTPFAETIKNIQARIIYSSIPNSNLEVTRNTVYCISPYKTGTTYLASCFRPEISQHEPFHHASLKYLDKNFDRFFTNRMNRLNLKLECSGFWSAYIDELYENEIARDLKYLWILRPPSSWVTSLINYYHRRDSLLYFKFDFVVDLFWKRKIGIDLREFTIGANTKKNQELINNLIQVYLDWTRKTTLLKNVIYIKIKEIDKYLSLVESLIDETSTSKNRVKNQATIKVFTYKNESLDAEYELLTARLIRERNVPFRMKAVC